MEQNNIRKSLPDKLEVIDLKYDIKRLAAELDAHKSKTLIFEEAIKAQQSELNEMIEVTQYPTLKEEIYR